MPPHHRTPPEGVSQKTFFDLLNSYKELLTVIVFFLGGFLWVYGIFATKRQVNLLLWYTLTYNRMIESRLAADAAEKEIDELTQVLKDQRRLPLCDTECAARIEKTTERRDRKIKEHEESIKNYQAAQTQISGAIERLVPVKD